MMPGAKLLLLAAASAPLAVPAGTPVPLETAEPLSSQSKVKGDLVQLRVAQDVMVDGQIAVPRGTRAIGQVVDAQARGGFGTSGILTIRPLYATIGGKTLRLSGSIGERASAGVETVVGMIALTPLLSGRSAVIPVGTKVSATLDRSVELAPH